MQETSKKIEECIFYKLDKVENLSKLDNFRKTLYSEFETERDISKSLCELFDDVSLLIIGKKTNVGIDSIKLLNGRHKENEILAKFIEVPNCILSILVERSNTVIYVQ